MKNLKKVLSLALAFAMVLGLVVVGSAADVTVLADWDSVSDKDSALLLGAFDIVKGDGDGNYYPEENISRVEAAAIISRAVWGGVDNVALYANGNVGGYTDVVNGAWYMGYVNYLTVTGVMTGKGEGEFDPDGNVTGYEFLKMALVALGYNAETEKLTGLGWDLRTMAIATVRGQDNLTEGTTVTDWNAPLSRMNAVTIAANMIWRNTVTYSATTGAVLYGNTFAVDVLGLTPVDGELIANAYTSNQTVTAINTQARSYAGENAYVAFNNNTYAVALDSALYDVGKPVEVYLVDGKVYAVALIEGTEVEPTVDQNGNVTNYDTDGLRYFVNDTLVATETTAAAAPSVIGASAPWSFVFTVNPNVEVKWFDTDADGYIDLVKAYTFTAQQMPKVLTDDDGNTWYDWNSNGVINAWYSQGTDYMTSSYAFGAAAEEYVALGAPLSTAFGTSYWYGYVLEGVEGKITRIAANKSTVYVDGYAIANVTETLDANLVYDKDGDFYVWADGTLAKFVPTTAVAADPIYAVLYDAGFEQIGSTTTVSGSTGVIVEVSAILKDGTSGNFEVASFTLNGDTFNVSKQSTVDGNMTDTDGNTVANVSLITSNSQGVTGGTLGAAHSAPMLVEYLLNEDGTLHINLDNIVNTTPFTGTVASSQFGSKYVNTKTITYVEGANNTWTAYFGATIPGMTGASATYVVADYLTTGDQAAYGYVMIPAGYTATSGTTQAVFYALSDSEQIGVDSTGKIYETTFFNSKTNKVETVANYGIAGNNPISKGEIYTSVTADVYSGAITGNAGDYISGLGENVIGVAGSTILDVDDDTLYILIDGENSKVITFADLSVQSAPSTGWSVLCANNDNDPVIDIVIIK